MTTIRSADLDYTTCYRLLSGCVVPRPIAWVSTGSDAGHVNVAPFSTFTWLSPWPPIVGFNCEEGETGPKDTCRNIKQFGDYVINIADRTFLDDVDSSAKLQDAHISEATELGLATCASALVGARRLRDVPISLECTFRRSLRFDGSRSEFIIGDVKAFHVRDGLFVDGKVNTPALDPLFRIGGPNYGTIGDTFAKG